MSTVRLAQAYIPQIYGGMTSLNSPENARIVTSGIVHTSPFLNQVARSAGTVSTLPFWLDIDASAEPNYSNDDPADLATPLNITSASQTFRKAYLNQSFSAMDLVAELSGSDPLTHIKNRFGTYWQRQAQKRLIASAVGVMLDNIANDSSDMTIDVGAVVGAGGVFSAQHVINAVYTMGDNADGAFIAMAVHSNIMKKMVENDEIVYIQDSLGKLTIPTYKGMEVIMDDGLYVTGAGDARVYTTILFGRKAFGFGSEAGHAFGFGEGVPTTPTWTDRTEQAGNGGGEESIGERKTWIMHPAGFDWTDAGGGALVEFSPTLANLRTAAKWNRKVDRKNIPMAFLLSRAVA